MADHEFLIEALLTNLDVETILLPELLVVPELPEARGAVRLDAAGGLQGAESFCAQIVAVNLQCADVEGAAIPAEGALRIHLQNHLGEPVVSEALLEAASDITEHFAGFLHGEGDAVLAQEGAEAPHVAEQEVAPRYPREKPERAYHWLGCLELFRFGRDRDRGWRGEGAIVP